MRVALELFATRGLEGVGIREIVSAAGLKNLSAVRYYFGSKDALIREVIIAGAEVAETWRREQLEALLARGQHSLREVLRIMVGPGGGEGSFSHLYIRLLATVVLNNPELNPRRLAPALTRTGYDACWLEAQRFLKHIPANTRKKRFEYLAILILSTVATRAVEACNSGREALWASPRDLEYFLDALEGLLNGP